MWHVVTKFFAYRGLPWFYLYLNLLKLGVAFERVSKLFSPFSELSLAILFNIRKGQLKKCKSATSFITPFKKNPVFWYETNQAVKRLVGRSMQFLCNGVEVKLHFLARMVYTVFPWRIPKKKITGMRFGYLRKYGACAPWHVGYIKRTFEHVFRE